MHLFWAHSAILFFRRAASDRASDQQDAEALQLYFDSFCKEYRVTLKGSLTHTTPLGSDIYGNITHIDNLLDGMEQKITTCRTQIEEAQRQLAVAREQVTKPFPQEDELKTKSALLDELNILLNLDKRDDDLADAS